MTSAEGTLTLTCIYCGHTWPESLTDLKQAQQVFYRGGTEDQPPTRTEEYLVQCPNCGRRMKVTVQVRGA